MSRKTLFERMSEAQSVKPDHERIWLQPLCCVGHAGERQWCEDNVWPDNDECKASGVEYVRADLARPEQQNTDINAVGLEPCPWCKVPPIISNRGMNAGANVVECLNRDCPVAPHTNPLSHAEAIAAWNTRAFLPEPTAQCDHVWVIPRFGEEDERVCSKCRVTGEEVTRPEQQNAERDLGVYPGCRNPAECRKRGYCPLDPNCGD
jgi:hypothetical protein